MVKRSLHPVRKHRRKEGAEFLWMHACARKGQKQESFEKRSLSLWNRNHPERLDFMEGHWWKWLHSWSMGRKHQSIVFRNQSLAKGWGFHGAEGKPGGALWTQTAVNMNKSVISMANPKICYLGYGELFEGPLKSMAPFPSQLAREHCSPRDQSRQPC